MKTSEEIKDLVREKYAQIALQTKETNESSCCGSGTCSTVDYAVFSDDYSKMDGYNPDADLGLGCGIPTQFAVMKKGDTVLDLGSGAGNDVFVAREIVGESGYVIGVDFTMEMIKKAKENAKKLGFDNVQFRFGEIEDLPVTSNKIDAVISNCVLNLVPDKQKAFGEIHRVLKPGGHFSISDVVLQGELPETILNAAEMYAGCVSGALQKDDYLGKIYNAGFEEIEIMKEKEIILPDDILSDYLNDEQIKEFKNSNTGIYSITVRAEKPGKVENDCGCGCDSESCCQ
ncbi:MAG: arsenite methyltransferase [Saprospiraceae bacterium]|nr:arsenite methyltransferase [Saprospiraceae bacterium]